MQEGTYPLRIQSNFRWRLFFTRYCSWAFNNAQTNRIWDPVQLWMESINSSFFRYDCSQGLGRTKLSLADGCCQIFISAENGFSKGNNFYFVWQHITTSTVYFILLMMYVTSDEGDSLFRTTALQKWDFYNALQLKSVSPSTGNFNTSTKFWTWLVLKPILSLALCYSVG